MSKSRDVSAITAMIGAELLLATVNATVKWAGSWPSVRIMLVRFSIEMHITTCTHYKDTTCTWAVLVHVTCTCRCDMCMRLSLSLTLTLTFNPTTLPVPPKP